MQLETVGEVIRVLRSRLSVEQVELARACGWRDASAVSRIETDRVRPTRRTLAKLAENLSDPAVTGTVEEVQAWLFLAAGVLPTPSEVDQVEDHLPAIDSWPQPAAILDFAWYLWRANPLLRKMAGIPDNFVGRHALEMFFQENGSMRRHFGDRWEAAALRAVTFFRAETDRRNTQRWYKKTLSKLNELPDFRRIWALAAKEKGKEQAEIYQRTRTETSIGTIAVLRLTLRADPRLTLVHIIPEDVEGTRSLRQQGFLLD
jgi:transcriptional regulator with XRE-family HTH domain